MVQDVSQQVQSPHTRRTGNYSFTWASTHLCTTLTHGPLPGGQVSLQNSCILHSCFLFYVILSSLEFLLLFLFKHLHWPFCMCHQDSLWYQKKKNIRNHNFQVPIIGNSKNIFIVYYILFCFQCFTEPPETFVFVLFSIR